MIEISGFFDTQRTKSRHNKAERTTTQPSSRSFNSLLDSAMIDGTDDPSDIDTKVDSGSSDDLLPAINDAKKELLVKPSWKRAQKYRQLVSEFLNQTTKQLLQLESHESAVNGDGPTRKKFVIVRKIHAELDELVDMVLSSHSSALQILEKVGAIHGLLINLQT